MCDVEPSSAELFLEPPSGKGLRELVGIADGSGANWSMPGFFTLPSGATVFHLVIAPSDEFRLAADFTANGWVCRERPE